MSSIQQMETSVQPTIDAFVQKIKTVGDDGRKPLDIATWLMYFTFDALGLINFSEDLGHLEKGADTTGAILNSSVLLAYFSVVGQAPWVHKLLFGNTLLQRLLPLEQTNDVQNVGTFEYECQKSGQHG